MVYRSELKIDEKGLTYNSESYYSGCGEERYSFFVSWDEIEQPHGYFVEKYKKEWETYFEQQRLYKENEKKWEDIKNIYPIINALDWICLKILKGKKLFLKF